MVPEKSMRIGQPDEKGPSEPRGSASEGIRRLASKFVTDVMPSVVATVLGAWIVSHYVNTDKQAAKPISAVQSEAPVSVPPAQSAVSTAPAVRVIPGASVVPMPSPQPKPASPRDDPAPEQRGEKPDGDERKMPLPTKAVSPAPRRAAGAKTPAPPAKVQAQKQSETQVTSSVDAAPIVAPATVTPPESAPVVPALVAPSAGEPPQTASAAAEDALEKARKALERAKADKDAQQPVAAPELATAAQPERAPAGAGASSEVVVVRTPPASSAEISPVPPLPPPVIVAQPPLPTRSANADPEPAYPAQADDGEDRPIPPALIPNAPRGKGGFLLIR